MRPIDSKAPVSEISDKIISILRAGILAPSTHNTQPWLFEVNHNSCKIYVDPKLTLKEADPDGRNLYISIGCLLENIDIAARQYGLKATFRYFRQTKENLVATVSFDTSEPAEKREELFNVIAERYTYRGNFDKYRIDEAVLKELITINNMSSVMLSLFDKKDDIKSLAKITHDSLIRVANKKSFRIELAKWMNSSYSSKKDGIPGYAYGFPAILSLITPILMQIVNPSKMMAKKTTDTILSSSLICIVSTLLDAPKQWIEAGRVIQRIMLYLVANDLKVSISVASIQDRDGLIKLSKYVDKRYKPQFFLCAGYSTVSRRITPRYSLEEKLK